MGIFFYYFLNSFSTCLMPKYVLTTMPPQIAYLFNSDGFAVSTNSAIDNVIIIISEINGLTICLSLGSSIFAFLSSSRAF